MIKEAQKKRLTYISDARIIGILLVVFGHSFPFNVEIPTVLQSVKDFIYCFHMPLFIFLSAYLVTKTDSIARHSTGNYIKSRAKRLLIPYVVLTVLCFVPKVLVSAYINDNVNFSIDYFIKTLFVPRQNVWGHFWFLPVIFFMALSSIVYGAIIKKNKTVAVIVCAVTFALLFLPKTTDWFAIEDIKKNLCWYTLGMLVGSGPVLEKIKIKSVGFVLIAVSIITFVFTRNLKNDNSFLFELANCAIAFLMIAGIILVCSMFDLTKIRVFKAVDQQSFAIFIMSWPVQAVVEILLNKIFKLPVLLVMIAMFISGVAAPLIVTEVINFAEKKFDGKVIGKCLKTVKIIIGM